MWSICQTSHLVRETNTFVCSPVTDGSSAYDHVDGVEYIAMLATGSLQKPQFNIITVDVVRCT